jgi:RNA polymerase sigma factor (TIGR02999 family)
VNDVALAAPGRKQRLLTYRERAAAAASTGGRPRLGVTGGFGVDSRRISVTTPSLSALIDAADRGEPAAAESLFTHLYGELHRIARRELSRHGWGVSLGATSLLHEAYMDLAKVNGDRFPDEQRFMGYAARVMRGLIIDYARSRQAQKRGGQFELTAISTDVVESVAAGEDLDALGAALDELAKVEPLLADVVDLKFFCGFSVPEIAAMKHVSERTIERSWQKARLFLHRTVREDVLRD